MILLPLKLSATGALVTDQKGKLFQQGCKVSFWMPSRKWLWSLDNHRFTTTTTISVISQVSCCHRQTIVTQLTLLCGVVIIAFFSLLLCVKWQHHICLIYCRTKCDQSVCLLVCLHQQQPKKSLECTRL